MWFSKQFGWKLKLLSMFWCTLFLKVEAFSSSVWNYSWLRLVPMGSQAGISSCKAGYVHRSALWISESSAVYALFALRKGPLDFCSWQTLTGSVRNSRAQHPSVAAKFNLCNGDASGQWQCCSPGLMQLADLEPHSELRNSSILLNKLPSFIFHFTFLYFFCDKVSTKFASSLALVHHLKLLWMVGFLFFFTFPRTLKLEFNILQHLKLAWWSFHFSFFFYLRTLFTAELMQLTKMNWSKVVG